ncbi:MAG TPA: hypothetical protein VNM91_01955 [Dehalococcoidia bacterium]|nr:hypothetical protein [Dehalococcoidia bacterium]
MPDPMRIPVAGDVVQWDELLNGTQSVALEGRSDDGRWTVSALLTWNIGLEQRDPEGDLTLSCDDGADGGSEVFGTATAQTAREDPAEPGVYHLAVDYEIDGGDGGFAGVTGTLRAELRVWRDSFAGECWIAAAGG